MTTSNRLKNRLYAGELLARRLAVYRNCSNIVVLALPRGGVPVGFSVAKKLGAPLDIITVRKLGVPGHEASAMGAIASSGLCVLKAEVVEILDIPTEVIEAIAHRELREIERREKLYRTGHRALQVQGKTVILVDDGLATGASMLVAVKAIRKLHPEKIIVAVPVATPESYSELAHEVDEIVCLRTPEPFQSVGLWYDDFAQVTDAEVLQLLTEAESWKSIPEEHADQVIVHPDSTAIPHHARPHA